MAGKRNPGALAGAAGAGNVSQDCGPDADEAIASSLDLQVIHVELSERRRERGDCVSVAACSIATVEGTAASICKLARKLLHLGVDARTPLSIWRGRTKCFHDLPVSRWAELTVKEGQSSPVFAPYVPFSGTPVASQGAKSDG
jgi:hypothetical protein